ncbi:sugar ABC transporter ATP-binding protein, partial [Thioclava sp. BHET1]
VALRLRGVQTAAHPGKPVDLELRRGEILGLAGLVGAGRTELACTIFGVEPMLAGTLELDGRPLRLASAAEAVGRGIFLVPEDRKATGLVLDMSITENVTLPDLPRHARRMIVSRQSEGALALRQKADLDIRAARLTVQAKSLSGGNQQKVVLAKWLSMQPQVMIFDEPTRGIDVGAKAEIYRLMRRLADAGVAVLMISSDMEEVIGTSDRIAVMHEGRITGTLAPEEFSEENVLLLAVGRPANTRAIS